MVKVALFVRLEAKPGKEKEVESFLLAAFHSCRPSGHYGVVRNSLGAVHLRYL